MSVTAHPNLHAVGLTADIYEAIEQRLRGRAAEDIGAFRCLDAWLGPTVTDLVSGISTTLDEEFGDDAK